jgi:hypothetical protein
MQRLLWAWLSLRWTIDRGIGKPMPNDVRLDQPRGHTSVAMQAAYGGVRTIRPREIVALTVTLRLPARRVAKDAPGNTCHGNYMVESVQIVCGERNRLYQLASRIVFLIARWQPPIRQTPDHDRFANLGNANSNAATARTTASVEDFETVSHPIGLGQSDKLISQRSRRRIQS